MSLASPPRFHLAATKANRLTLESDQGDVAQLFVLDADIIRVMVLPGGRLDMARTWAIAPGQDDVPPQGRDRFDLSDFSLPDFIQTLAADSLTIETQCVRLTVRLSGLFCRWEAANGAARRGIVRPRPIISAIGTGASATICAASPASSISAWASAPAT